jgi:hypothetical protein
MITNLTFEQGLKLNKILFPLFIKLICSHVILDSLSLFMSISILISLNNMDMKRHVSNVPICIFMVM